MEYYYTQKKNITQNSLIIAGSEARHIIKVLRKKQGDRLFVTDGEGSVYEISIAKILQNAIECSILNITHPKTEPEIKVTLFQSLLRNPSRFEFAIEKASELGVYSIVPLITEHVVNKSANKLTRWQTIALAAMKQSQRAYLPKVTEPADFKTALNMNFDEMLIAHTRTGENNAFNFTVKENKSIGLFIGPEGGFSENEIIEAKQRGCRIISIGKRKFRSETASLVLLTKILC